MQGAARLFFTLAIVYAILGMLLGLSMAISEDHGQMPTHAHIMLAGWVSSALLAYFYHLFPASAAAALRRTVICACANMAVMVSAATGRLKR